MTTDASVYIHIPFCIKKCRYCSFYSLGNAGAEIKRSYKDALIKQLRSFGNEFGELRLDTLYFGGGTPPAIGVEDLCAVIREVSDVFIINGDAEITVEINPLSVTESDIALLKDCGVNRFSIGLQSSDDAMLKKLGRIHTVSDFLKTYEICRKYSSNVSVDLMFALPDQGMEHLRNDVEFVCGLKPEHVSLYCLTLDSTVDLYRHRNEYSFADDDAQADMYMYICDRLKESGYTHYEVSNFALQGRESRHNSKCWERFEYIGFGASAHSFFKNRRYAFKNSISEYIKRGMTESYSDFSGIYSVAPLTKDEAESERIMLGLRMNKGIAYDRPVPETLIKNGFVIFDNGILSLTDKGMFVSNAIINSLI